MLFSCFLIIVVLCLLSVNSSNELMFTIVCIRRKKKAYCIVLKLFLGAIFICTCSHFTSFQTHTYSFVGFTVCLCVCVRACMLLCLNERIIVKTID